MACTSRSAAGVWQALVCGFDGVRGYDGELSIASHLPPAWDRLSFWSADRPHGPR
jgi:alpha,alpha-trehalose phosphorylase